MKVGFSSALLIVGIMLIVWGVRASDSLGSNLSQMFSGLPSDNVIWLLALGAASTIIGLFGLVSYALGRRVP